MLELFEIVGGHLADREWPTASSRSCTVTGRPERARKDRAAIDEDRRYVEPAHGHHHARKRLVAAGHADQCIVAMAAHGELDGIGDDLARGQRGLHALMPHGDAVGDGDGAEFARRASAAATPCFTACAWRISEMLQGAASFQQVATPTKGWWICSRERPMA